MFMDSILWPVVSRTALAKHSFDVTEPPKPASDFVFLLARHLITIKADKSGLGKGVKDLLGGEIGRVIGVKLEESGVFHIFGFPKETEAQAEGFTECLKP